jgi:hypothetical protein
MTEFDLSDRIAQQVDPFGQQLRRAIGEVDGEEIRSSFDPLSSVAHAASW